MLLSCGSDVLTQARPRLELGVAVAREMRGRRVRKEVRNLWCWTSIMK